MRIITAGDDADISHNSAFTAIWSYVECALGAIVACAISFPKLYQAKGGRLRTFISGVAKKLSLGSSQSAKSSQDNLPHLSEIRLPSDELRRWDSEGKTKDPALVVGERAV
jgi:hypothetical protein